MRGSSLLEEALASPHVIISIMGPHAGESSRDIFQRKAEDILKHGVTYWLVKSAKAAPPLVQKLCRSHSTYVFFVEASSVNGARPTDIAAAAKQYSTNNLEWRNLPAGIGPVTGKLDSRAYALVLDALATDVEGTVDLWAYADFTDIERPVKTILGCSTVCVVKKNMRDHPEKMKSRFRHVRAVARLGAPHGVYVR